MVATMALKITCFPPVETITSSAAYSIPLSRLNFSPIAIRNASVPATSVYFVSPARIAAIAASLIFSGVSKSGSPALRLIIFRPAAFSARALVVMAIVWLGLILSRRAAMRDIGGFQGGKTAADTRPRCPVAQPGRCPGPRWGAPPQTGQMALCTSSSYSGLPGAKLMAMKRVRIRTRPMIAY